MFRKLLAVFSSLYVAISLGCAQAPVTPTVPAYEPRFSYDTATSTEKINVTVGVVAPNFVGDGIVYNTNTKRDETVKSMLRGVRASFASLLIAKGFNVTGPFESLDEMTFPDKKGSDFVLYPEFDLDGGFAIKNRGTKPKATGFGAVISGLGSKKGDKEETIPTCTYSIRPRGTINIVAREPLSKEKMWIKKVEVAGRAFEYASEGDPCLEGREWPQEVRNAWAQSHEDLFKVLMTSLDAQVNSEEFQKLKKQSAELRERKVY
jgi:hypothetical protein